MFFDVQRADATEFIKGGGAAGRALFFSWPRDVMESCLKQYEGDTVFWVGEDATDMMSPTDSEWVEVHGMEIPVWHGQYDRFVAYNRRSSMSS